MLTILGESVQGKNLKAFRTLRWTSSNNLPDTATKTFWSINTLQRKFVFIEYMKMKMFFGNLSVFEYRCLMDAPGVLTDDLFIESLIASRQMEDKELLLQRLNILQRILNRQPWNFNLYYTLSGVTHFTMQECRKTIRKADKYSGYVRNSSSVGSKNSKRGSFLEPETFEWDNNEQIDFLRFLTVGELSMGMPGDILFTLTRTKSPKRTAKLNLTK